MPQRDSLRATITSPNRGASRAALIAAAGIGGLAALAIANRFAARRAQEKHPPHGRFVRVGGVWLNIVEEGSGPPVLLVHGNAALVDDMLLSGLVDALSPRHRVIVVGRPGFGYSERPHDRRWTMQEQADVLALLIEHLHLERPLIFGHSQGTTVCVALALQHPHLVRGLVLASGYYVPEFHLNVALGATGALPVYGPVMNATIMPPLMRRLAPIVMRKVFAPSPVPPHMAEFPVDLATRPLHLQSSADDLATLRRDAGAMAGRYHELRMPISLFCGDGDRILDVIPQALALQREVPHATLTIFPNAGHMLHHTHTHEIVRAIDAMQEQDEPRPAPRLVASLH